MAIPVTKGITLVKLDCAPGYALKLGNVMHGLSEQDVRSLLSACDLLLPVPKP